jgi:hypothetical protein
LLQQSLLLQSLFLPKFLQSHANRNSTSQRSTLKAERDGFLLHDVGDMQAPRRQVS